MSDVCLLFAVRRSTFDACCLLFVAVIDGVVSVIVVIVVCGLLTFAGWCLMFVVCCLLRVV